MRKTKTVISFMFSRLFMVVMMLALQLALLVMLVVFFSQASFYTYLSLNLISLLVIATIVSNDENPSYKITWIISIMIFPLVGGTFYLLLGQRRLTNRVTDVANAAIAQTKENMPAYDGNDASGRAARRLEAFSPSLAVLGRYIYNMSGNPVWEDFHSEYFPLGDDMFGRMLDALRVAKRYIFLEFFIVRPGQMLDSILEILREKLAQGVEVRFLYDDLGSIGTLPQKVARMMRDMGIKTCIFNPFRPRVSFILNNRDHRKLLIVDGKAAFCGGINLSDEYINRLDRFGHWKDSGVMLGGPAVWGFAFMFLQQWEAATGQPQDYAAYRAAADTLPAGTPWPAAESGEGLAQVFGDSPLDRVNVTETAYLSIIMRAMRYVYITTPYLVIDHEMEAALCAAAESGVDVRLITPCRYDKWYVHLLTRGHYPRLLRSGVRVFEYTPGFMHAKTFVSDDAVCMVGTCNMDFRSFYLHFEATAALYASDTVRAVREDFMLTQQRCHEFTLEESLRVSLFTRMLRGFLKIFAPLI